MSTVQVCEWIYVLFVFIYLFLSIITYAILLSVRRIKCIRDRHLAFYFFCLSYHFDNETCYYRNHETECCYPCLMICFVINFAKNILNFLVKKFKLLCKINDENNNDENNDEARQHLIEHTEIEELPLDTDDGILHLVYNLPIKQPFVILIIKT